MASTIVTFDFALKEWYTKSRMEDLIFSDRPFLGSVKRETEFQGSGHPVPILYRAPQGISVDLADAQSNATNVEGLQFLITAGTVSASVEIGDKVMKASRANPGAFLQNKKTEIDNLHEGVADTVAIALAGDGGQSLGRRAGALSGNVLTLLDKGDVHKFHVGMRLVASDNPGATSTDSLRAGTPAVVTEVNLAAGTVTSTTWGNITSFAANDYLFRAGMFNGNEGKFVMWGVQAYIPSAAVATPTQIYSSGARTADRVRLAGHAIPAADLTGKGLEERIQILGSRMSGRGMAPGPDCYYLNPEDWQNLAISLQSRGTRALSDESTRFGYKYLSVIAGAKEAKVYADRYFPVGTVFGLKKDSWTLYSLTELIHKVNGDGLEMLRKSTTNDYEYRLVSYPGLGCNAPGHNGRAPL
jgi:hypothetical protein